MLKYNRSRAGRILNIHFGNSRSKIQACNADIDKAADWDAVLLMSDDMIIQRHGFDDVIADEFSHHHPDYDGALWFCDGTESSNRGLCTLSILGREYYDRFGYIYNPQYKSFYCDNEYTEIGTQTGKLTKLPYCIIRHNHPDWGGTFDQDKLYAKNNRFWAQDERTYFHRRGKNFGL